MQLLIYQGTERRKPLVAIAEVEWEVATLGVGTNDLNSDTCTNELVYDCVGAAFWAHHGKKNPSKDIPVNEATFCRLVDSEKGRPVS